MSEKSARFNEILVKSIDASIIELLGENVLSALNQYLTDRLDVTREELPYRLASLYTVLEEIFGFKGARTLQHRIAEHLSNEISVPLPDAADYTLQMYVQKAIETGSFKTSDGKSFLQLEETELIKSKTAREESVRVTRQERSGINYVCSCCGALLYLVTPVATPRINALLQPDEVAALVQRCSCGHILRITPDLESVKIFRAE